MENFERAHVFKKKKSDNILKNELKQILQSYKGSDDKFLKEYAAKNDYDSFQQNFEDSASVSGFSDLNLTNSGDEDNSVHVTLNTDSNLNISEDDEQPGPSNINIQSSTLNSTEKNVNDSILGSLDSSEYSASIQSFSDDGLDFNDTILNLTDESSSRSSEVNTTVESNSETEDFDPDGALASRIFVNLGKIDKPKIRKNRNKKRKLLRNNSEEENVNKGINLKLMKQSSDKDDTFDDTTEEAPTQSIDQDSVENLSDLDLSDQSSPYISIAAENMPEENLDDILGNYKHPTNKNLTPENQCSLNYSHIFSDQNISLNDVTIEEEADSLVPELDENLTVEDLDMNTLESSCIDESTTLQDTVLSELELDKDDSLESIQDLESSIKIFYGKNTCIFIMKHPTELYLHGKVQAQLLGGTVETFGYKLKDHPCEIYAPNYNYAHCLKTIESTNAYYGLFGKLTSTGLSVSTAEEIVSTIGEHDAIISLSYFSKPNIEFIEQNFTVSDLFSKQSKHVQSSLLKASRVLGCSLYVSKPFKYFEESPYWDQAVEYGLEPNSRGIVFGGKGTGKSTFLRYCVNRLLSNGPVLVIDLDPGQAEFTVAGNVSATVVTKPLIGPNFTHLCVPERVLHIGLINVLDNSTRYMTAVEKLITFCKNNKKYDTMPWIVNTMGLCNNMGLKLAILTILRIQPTYVLQIDSRNPKKQFECDLQPYNISNMFENMFKKDRMFSNVTCPEDLSYKFVMSNHTESKVKSLSLSPRDERYLNFLAYFGELLNSHSGPGLLGIVPYEVQLPDLNIGMNVRISEDAVTKVINGKIIALCQLNRDKGKLFTLEDNAIPCVGHGLIRGVDLDKGILYIITPIESKRLREVDTLVYADWTPELRGQERHLPMGTKVPYRTASSSSLHRGLMTSPRRRFNPLQLLKISRNS